MKISISLPDDDVAFLDSQASQGAFSSRSAVIHSAIRLLHDRQYVDSYAAAWDEWDADDGAMWDTTLADGLA
jgi:putative addiction module CopG family antidote